ncbi:MAG: topoisomerase DNA-binding C4 zinc finger domain-containing protein, partial [Nanoarchaeota archaeon]
AKIFLTSLLADFKKKELAVGKDLLASVRETQDEQNFIGQCPSCSKGKLMIRFGKFGRFIACDQYPACSTTFKIPAKGMIKRAEKECESCKYPVILLIAKRRKQQLCINPQCKTKVSDQDKKDIKALEKQKTAKKCPTCGKDLLVRNSFYGSFLGCTGYPQCKYTENLDGSKGFKKSEKKEIDSK